jgi:hypothetical protein
MHAPADTPWIAGAMRIWALAQELAGCSLRHTAARSAPRPQSAMDWIDAARGLVLIMVSRGLCQIKWRSAINLSMLAPGHPAYQRHHQASPLAHMRPSPQQQPAVHQAEGARLPYEVASYRYRRDVALVLTSTASGHWSLAFMSDLSLCGCGGLHQSELAGYPWSHFPVAELAPGRFAEVLAVHQPACHWCFVDSVSWLDARRAGAPHWPPLWE